MNKKNIHIAYRIFFSIIRCGIWGEDESCLDKVDWELLFQIAKEQCGRIFLCRLM